MTRPIHGGNLDWAVSLVNCPVEDIIDFSASINPLGPPQSAIAAINSGISQLKHYPNPDYPLFREVIAEKHQLTSHWVLPANGAAELFTWIAWEARDLQGVLLPAPCFADYKRALSTFNVNFISYSLSSLEQGLEIKKRDKLALLVNNPHNPTGKLWTKQTLQTYLNDFALVIVDEAFMDFLPPDEEQSLIPLVKDYSNLIIVRSLTKFYSLPGLRIGYGVSNPQRIKNWQAWRDPWSVNTLAALAGTAALQDHNFAHQTWLWLKDARARLDGQLTKIAELHTYPSTANFLLVKTQLSSPMLQLELLKREHILIRDCLSFPELGDTYFRVAIRTEEENNRLSNAILQICHQH